MTKTARANHLSAVKKIVLEVGQFSGVEPELLRFAFQYVRKESILEGAQIEIMTPPLALFCKNCQVEYAASWDNLRCPTCGNTSFEILQGRELRVKSITGNQNDGEGDKHAG